MNMFIVAIARIIDMAFNIYFFIVIARALISWVNPDPYNPIVRFCTVQQIRFSIACGGCSLFLHAGAFDFSPIVLLILLSLAQQLIMSFLYQLAG